MKNRNAFLTLLVTVLTTACAHSEKVETTNSSTPPVEEKMPVQAKGYGDFLFMPPGSIAIRNFVDKDGDKVDDRYQMAPGTKGLPMGYFYKKK